ncbi:hypothetical protein [Bradyrhizobium sp. BR 10261]|nr:hypothetical protein [Bradyrhizobium sp. BR 10261]MBW7963262.1 hypothetical protein [Bradyrhizobium sp. BR 10261]
MQDDNTTPKEPRDGQRPSSLEEARKVIEDYANELREMLRKLRRKMDENQ